MKRIFCFLFVLVLILGGCSIPESELEPVLANYTGTLEGYKYFHTGERDRAWEEDILYLAEGFLETHPILTNEERMHKMIVMDPDSSRFEYKYEYTDEFYDEAVKNEFVSLINQLIPQIPGLTDAEITYELLHILTILEDAHVGINDWSGACVPMDLEVIYEDNDPSYYAVRVPQGFEHLLLGKLTAINSVPIDDIVDRFRAYQTHENDYWLFNRLGNSYCYGCFLVQMDALHIIGVAEADATDVVYTFETCTGTVDAAIQTMSTKEYESVYLAEQLVSHPMLKKFAYNARKGNYWYDLMNEGKTLYIRFSSMYEDPEYLLYNFRGEVQKIIREAEEPLQLIFDFRNNGGGRFFIDELNGLTTAINQSATNGVYILINSGSFSAGNLIPYRLSQTIEGAQLVGSPTGQYVNTFGDPIYFTMPHHGYEFAVSSVHYKTVSEVTQDALYPDIWVEQTLEDYKSGVDTVMNYVLSLE